MGILRFDCKITKFLRRVKKGKAEGLKKEDNMDRKALGAKKCLKNALFLPFFTWADRKNHYLCHP